MKLTFVVELDVNLKEFKEVNEGVEPDDREECIRQEVEDAIEQALDYATVSVREPVR